MKNKNAFFKQKLMVLTIFVALFASQVTLAQDRWSFEFRPSVNVPTKDLGDADLKTGFGFEGVFAYRFMPHLSVYAGWGWNRFGSDDSFAGSNMDFEETGYTYGLQFIHPIGQTDMSILARAGALSNHIEVENEDGDIIADSGHGYDAGFGWQVETGLSIPLSDSWNLMPSLRYRSLPRDLTIDQITTSVDLNYLSVGVGLTKTF